MKKIVATFMSIVMMLAILVPSALAQTESQFYDQWYEDTSWKLAKCYYNWNSTGCLGCAGINEEFITAYEYYKSVYPNSKYLAQYTNLYNSTVANKAMYDAMDESQRHIVANGYQAPCSGYFGQMTRCNGDTAFYNFYCDDGSIVENVQVSISTSEKWIMSVMTISVLSSGLLRHLTEMANGKLLAMPQLLLSVVML